MVNRSFLASINPKAKPPNKKKAKPPANMPNADMPLKGSAIVGGFALIDDKGKVIALKWLPPNEMKSVESGDTLTIQWVVEQS